MAINLMRVDDRLIHSQIVIAWSKSYSTQRILIVDDIVAEDEFFSNVLRMFAPHNVELIITKCDNAKNIVFQYENDLKNTMVLFKNPITAKYIFDLGIKYNSLNVGGMGHKSDRKPIYKNVSASEKEIETLKQLQNQGIHVYFQYTPTNTKVELSQVI